MQGVKNIWLMYTFVEVSYLEASKDNVNLVTFVPWSQY